MWEISEDSDCEMNMEDKGGLGRVALQKQPSKQPSSRILPLCVCDQNYILGNPIIILVSLKKCQSPTSRSAT